MIFNSVKKTNRLVIVEEGWPFAGVGAQISHEVSSHCFDYLDAPIERVTQEDVPLPYAHNLEVASLPNIQKVNLQCAKLCISIKKYPNGRHKISNNSHRSN